MREIDRKVLIKVKGTMQIYIMIIVSGSAAKSVVGSLNSEGSLAECSIALQPVILELELLYKEIVPLGHYLSA